MLTGQQQLDKARLDSLGSNDRGDGMDLTQSAKTLVNMAAFLITKAQQNLNKAGAEATGELESSISARDIDITGKVMSIDIELLDRYKFTDLGVNGVEVKRGSPYSFKSKKVGTQMMRSIKRWVKTRAIRATKYKAISKVERKDKSLSRIRKKADSQESLAYAIATNIKKKGIKPTKFFTNAVRDTEREFKKEIAAGFRIDLINSLKNGT